MRRRPRYQERDHARGVADADVVRQLRGTIDARGERDSLRVHRPI
jgi:hypothetical protein